MLTRVTKKHIQELVNLIKTNGYWSKEVYEYNAKFEHHAMKKLNNEAKYKIRYEA